MQDLLPIGAFAALLFIGFAVSQSVRERPRVGTWGTILAFVAVSVSVLVLTLANDDAESASRVTMVVLANAVIVLVVSLVILVLDWRRPTRDLDHSFGVLGIGVSVLLIVGSFATPSLLALVSDALPGETVALAAAGQGTDTMANAPAAPGGRVFPTDGTAPTGAPMGDTAAPGAGFGDNPAANNAGAGPNSALPQLLMAQTGLTMDELNTQMEAGTSLADLVAANDGDLNAVTAALTQAVETAIADGTIPEQMASRMGDDVAGMVAQAVNGEMPPQAVSLMFGSLLQSGAGAFPAGGMPNPGSGDAPMNPPAGGEGAFPANADMSGAAPNNQMVEAVPTTEVPAAVMDEPTEVVTEEMVTEEATPAPVVIIVTATPMPEPTTAPIVFEDTGVCQVAVNYMINLRVAPNVESPIQTTIPYAAIVNSAGHNASGWWQVTYQGVTGWVSGEFITANGVCQSLPTLP